MLSEALIKVIKENVSKSDDKVEAGKSRVKVYSTIKDALKKTTYGEPFSTSKADRLYVTTKKKWGKDKAQCVGDKVAKGFTDGSAKPGASWKDVKGYATRTSVKHAGKKAASNKAAFKNKRF